MNTNVLVIGENSRINLFSSEDNEDTRPLVIEYLKGKIIESQNKIKDDSDSIYQMFEELIEVCS